MRRAVCAGNPPFFSNLLDSAFLAYWLNTVDYTDYIDGSTRDKLTQGKMADIPVALPPLDVQRAIADFLDRKTAALDALIDKKERLLALLQEKRQALITQAVTKGLDPNVPMKDSGIEWLGEIPAHWTPTRLKHLTAWTTSGSRGWGAYYADDGPLFVRIGDVSPVGIDLDLVQTQRVSIPQDAEGARTRLRGGDLLVSITASIGDVAVVPDSIEEAYVSQHVSLSRPLPHVAPRWLAYAMSSSATKHQLSHRMYGGTKVGLSLSDVRDTWVAVPPPGEQHGIADSIDAACESLTRVANLSTLSRDHLREYRQALITAAVTGQLDVTSESNA